MGEDPLELGFLEGTSCEGALSYLGGKHAQANALLTRSLLALNGRYADREDLLSNHDELAVLPPVGG